MEEFDDALRAPGANGVVNLSHRAYATVDDTLWTWGEKVTLLNLSYNHIKVLDGGIGALSHMHTLDISSNALLSIPPEIGGCVRLRILHLNGNQLTSLPEELSQCRLVEEMYLSENRLNRLPQSIGEMLCLKKLMLANNNLKMLDCAIAQCKVLDDIDVSNNPLENVPEELRGDSAMILWIMKFEFEKSTEYKSLLGSNEDLEDQARLVSKLKLDVETLKERVEELEEENTKLIEERPHCYLAMKEKCCGCCKQACSIM